MKKRNDTLHTAEPKRSDIPPLDIIDLDSGDDIPTDTDNAASDTSDRPKQHREPDSADNADGNFLQDKLIPFISKINLIINAEVPFIKKPVKIKGKIAPATMERI